MPLTYKTYGCKFKCGFKHTSILQKVLEHEKKCWYNPSNKTCCTCKFGEIIHENDTHDELPGAPIEYFDYRECNCHTQENDIEITGIRPIEHCKYWKVSD